MIDPTNNTALCPFARTFITPGPTTNADRFCKGPACALWRWEKVTTAHPLWMRAVMAKADEIGEKPPYAKASRWVADNLEELGIVATKGFCGAGGSP